MRRNCLSDHAVNSLRNLSVLCDSAVMLVETETARDAEDAEAAQRVKTSIKTAQHATNKISFRANNLSRQAPHLRAEVTKAPPQAAIQLER